MKEKGILVVSFGTSYKETRERTIGAIEKQIAEKFEEWEVRRAFTSRIIIRKLRERDGICIDSVEEALYKMKSDGIRHVVIQPTHIIAGYENDEMMRAARKYEKEFDTFHCGRPLLGSDGDFKQLAHLLKKETDRIKPEQNLAAFVWLGHGSSHPANQSYIQLQDTFHQCGYLDFFMGTVEGAPDFGTVLKCIEDYRADSVVLLPLLIVSGEHALNDIGGDEDSWKSRLKARGYKTNVVLKGLGEYHGIQQMFVEHAADAMRQGREKNER